MRSSSFRRKIAALLLLGALALPWAVAGEPPSRPGQDQASEWNALDLLARFWHELASLWDEEGCSIDPYGRCIPGPGDGSSGSTTNGDNGCSIDPYGRCID